jgi:hypothetical protein
MKATPLKRWDGREILLDAEILVIKRNANSRKNFAAKLVN